MNDEHNTHDAQVFSQMDNADQVNARENKNGAAATTTATPHDEHPKDSTFRELSKDDTRYILYHMDPKEWDGMSTDQRKALLETLHPADKRALASFNLRPDDLAVMPLQTARGVLRASIINVANGIVNKTVYPDLPPEVKADSKELEIVLGREVAKLLHDPEYSARLDLLVKYHQGYRELEPFLKKAVKSKDFQGRTLDDIVTDSVQNHNDVLGPGMDMDDPATELGRLFAAARKMAARDEDLKRSTVMATLLEKGSSLPMLHGLATDQFAYLSAKDMLSMTTADMMHEVTRYRRKDGMWTVRIGNSRNARQQAVNADKILKVSQALYTAQSGKERGQNKAIEIPLDWYMQQVYPSTVKQDNADKAKEKNRLKNARKFARASINDDLETLFNSSVSWTECRNGSKTKDYHDYRIIDGKGIENGLIKVHITDALAQYFNSCPLTYFPIALLSISSRNPNAYRIGNLFAQHAYMVTNIVYQTADHLKVETVLQNTDLPSYEELKTAGKEDISRKWEERIKDPLEESLEILRRQEVIDDWYYCKAKGEPLTDEEATFTSYEQYRDAQICYVMHNPVDNAEAVMKKKEQISTARKKKRRKEAAKAKKKEENAGQK